MLMKYAIGLDFFFCTVHKLVLFHLKKRRKRVEQNHIKMIIEEAEVFLFEQKKERRGNRNLCYKLCLTK